MGRVVWLQCRQCPGSLRLGNERIRCYTFCGSHRGALGWMFAEWVQTRQAERAWRNFRCGAGLVAITPASGFVTPMPALLIGFVAGLFCFFMVTKVKQIWLRRFSRCLRCARSGWDLGRMLTGVFATNAVNNALKDSAGNPLPLGWVDGNAGQILNQFIGIAIAWVLAIVGTLVILKICDAVVGLRVSAEQETQGLDFRMHGEEGYIMES